MSSIEQPVWTVLDILRWGREYFTSKGVDSPRLTIELLLCHVLACSRLQLYMMYDRPLSELEKNILRGYCLRRAKREPLQYILGTAHFYGLEFNVDESVLIPRPETEIMVSLILEFCSALDTPIELVDIGTGSGCIPITLLVQNPNLFQAVTAIDISKQALITAQKNAEKHNVNINFKHLDILADKCPAADIIVSNPPYMTAHDMQDLQPELVFEPDMALTDYQDGLKFYRHFAKTFPHVLKPNGAFFLEIRDEKASEICALFQPITAELHVVKDLAGVQRIVWGRVSG
jgi:release factor glutamine methyltransferase